MVLSIVAASVLVVDPIWTRKPTGEEIARAYPDAAMRGNLHGSVILTCTMTDTGPLADCKAEEGEAPGMGFGGAALELSKKFRARGVDKSGQPVAGRPVKLPIRFILPFTATVPEIVVRKAGLSAGEVTLDCRLNLEGKLDNRYADGADETLRAAALDVAAGINSTARAITRSNTSRLSIPIAFRPPEP